MSDRLKYLAEAVQPSKPWMIENYICCWLFAGLVVLVLLLNLIFPAPQGAYDFPALLL